MPYFVYQITESVMVKNLNLLDEFESFKEAKNFAKEKRAENPDLGPETFKVTFAKNKLEAEEQLQEHRDEPILMEWEK
ncbi:MAG: hypothetical protein HUJ29_08165 [Gammaproteobacteria bacterium]|nr:hypothetical protein [Gammaproteobacteria bacterium]